MHRPNIPSDYTISKQCVSNQISLRHYIDSTSQAIGGRGLNQSTEVF